MKRCTALLHAHVAASSKDGSISCYKAASDGDAALSKPSFSLLKSDLETRFVCHCNNEQSMYKSESFQSQEKAYGKLFGIRFG
jgi:hypothetical protein